MNQVRLIGGQWRRQMLRFSDAEGLRPTPCRVRETLFNWLGQDVSGLSCLDLFAGSGALGFEAASRGAARVVMVERSEKVAATLKENARRLNACSIVEFKTMDALEYASLCMKRRGQEESKGEDARFPLFDVLFLDPPYRQGLLSRLEPLLFALAKPDAVIYAEAEFPVESLGKWRSVRQGRAGQVYFHLLRQEKQVG
ncbi:MAG: 16S rRNA (guanine(966)-N(2))-methyltransferase RsmD [Zoogloeaceae bacterium]|jgi:16S rRNA (guanine966-N2)-methyltransferase|nr:16S rRNA (guanine(966)-N(2))-methyltransferase RsmD [Zoogloeaceae bacterium]